MKRALLLVGGLVAALVARGDSATPGIAQSEAQADYIRFESRAWAADVHGEGGRLAANTVWTGEHVIVNDVYVPSGVTLTLAPGATIRFCEGTRIKVEDGGSLILNDAAGGEIVLTGLAADTAFVGITLQSDSATFRDNGHVVAGGFAFDAFATVSLRDTTAFLAGGLARVPVTVSGSRTRAFSFDWVAETNGVAFASGTMRWDKVGDGTKDILIPFGPEFAALDSFTVRASCLRCCTASRATSVVTLSAFVTVDVQTAEAWGNFVRFESRDWAADFADVANAEGGRLATNAVWSGEHVILNDVYVPSGVTLTLTADTRVRFCEGTMIKVEDGGTLRIVGADGHDVILCGYAEGTAYRGIDKMPSGTLADNGYVRVDSLAFASLARVALNNSDTFRTSGLALVPVTVSGSRDGPFSIDWVAETNGVAYKSGTLAWARASEGTKTISIGYGAELDGLDRFAVRVAVHRACFAKPDVCEVKIRDFAVADIQMAEARSAFIRFESRDWATNFVDVANAEGGRLTTNAVWSGEHVILNDVYIPSGVTLTLTADAVVRFCEGTMIKIEDGGVLNVIGAEGHDVILCDYDEETTSRGLVKMSAGTYADNMYVQYPDFRYGNYPDLTLHDAGIGRDAGKVYVPVTVSGASRSQPFNVDWETDKGASGTVAWKQSGDGTKWIEIPVDATPFGGVETYGIRLTAARGANLAVADATVTIYEFNHPVTESVSFSAGAEASAAFAVNGEIKRQPIFLNAAEELRYSGRWQSRLAPEDVFSRISVESDNGSVRLGEWPGTEEGTWTLDLADYKVGHYTLRHEILSSETRKVVDTVTKSFSIVDPDDVVLHGGTLTQSETWKAGKTHVVFETVVVPSAYTLFIEPGAIVKFMSGTGIDISQGGAFFANAIIFTHINDDTVGGDTLSDGYTVAPSMDSYFLSGNFTFGSDTEIRYITQPRALAGTISDRRVLSRGSTYRVSGTVTIANGASLTIPAGTVLKLADKAAIVVNSGGALFAQGTRSAPITITTVNDDSISGKADGSNSNPQPGDWDEIRNNGGTIEMSNVTLRYGGYGQYSNQGDAVVRTRSGTTRLEGCVVAHTNLRLLGCTSGRMTAVNCVLMDGWWGIDGAVGLVNGVISECLVGSNGGSVTNTVYYNCGTYSSGSKVGHCVAYGDVTTVQSGMTYADPLFVDPDAGDFRVVEGSPCVDAADSSVAPERDFYGQPRLTLTAQAVSAPVAQTNSVSGAQTNDTLVVQVQLADIGICEVMPRNVTSGIDLEARSVRGETNAVPGKMLFVKWEVRNVGGAEVDQPWRDTISLVSADGVQEVTLGDKETASLISEGGIAFCSGYFTVPALAEGTWYPKVNVNSYRDIFEGVLTTNNVLIGETAIRVESEAIDARSGCDGLIVGGMPEILKLAFDDEDENRMVRLSVPKGVTVRWGFDFMPSATRSSGSAVSDGSDILFRVPEDVSTVYLSLESDGNATYEVSAESGKVAITSVSPNTLPSSGEVTITIDGAGFMADSTVVLSRGGVEIAPESVQYVSAQQLVVTVDCAKLAAGAQYDVSIIGAENVATLATAVSVAAVKGEGRLEAKLILPDAVREGRAVLGYVEYANTGTADMDAPIFVVRGALGVTLVGMTADIASMTNSVKLVGISGSYPAGRLKVGEKMRLPFYLCVDGDYDLALCRVDEGSKSARDSVFPTWRSLCRAIAESASDLNIGNHRVCDYETVYDYAIRKANGEQCGILCGTLLHAHTGDAMPNRVVAVVHGSGKVVGRARTDKTGTFCFSALDSGSEYSIVGAGFELVGGEGLSPSNLVGQQVALWGYDYADVEMRARLEGVYVDGNAVSLTLEREGAGETVSGNWEGDVCRFVGLRDGTYSVSVANPDGQMICCSSNVQIVVSGGVSDSPSYDIPLERGGRIVGEFAVAGQSASNVSFVVYAPATGMRRVVQTDKDGGLSSVVPAGTYVISSTDGYRMKSGRSKSIEVASGREAQIAEDLVRMPFSVFPRCGPYPLPVVCDVDFLDDKDAVSSYQWDLNGDGTIDSTDERPRFTYGTEGKKTICLTVTYTNGTVEVYEDVNAVDVWDEAYVEPDSGTLILDDVSGYRVVDRSDDKIVLSYTHTAVPSDLSLVKALVVPGEEATPYAVLDYEALDDERIVLTIEPADLLSAYSSCRVMGMVALTSSDSEQVCPLKHITTPLLRGGFVMNRDGKWGERGRLDKKGEVAIGVDFDFGQLTLCYAVEKDDKNKVCRSAVFLHGDWKPGIDITGEATLTANKNLKNPYRPGNTYRVWESPEATIPIGWIPLSYKGGIEIGASAAASGTLGWHPNYKVDIGVDFAKGRDPICHDTFVEVDKSNSLKSTVTLSGALKLECYAQGFIEGYIGKFVEKRHSKKTVKAGVKIADTKVFAGLNCEVGMTVSADRYVQDEYSMCFGGRAGLEFVPFEMGLGGPWSFSIGEYKPDPIKMPIFEGKIRSPLPDLIVTQHSTENGAVTVSFKKNRVMDGHWHCRSSKLDFGDGLSSGWAGEDQMPHSYSASKDDKRTFTAVLEEEYYYDDLPLSPVKACSYDIVVHGASDDSPAVEIENFRGAIPRSYDPNEMGGIMGRGDEGTQRYVKPGEWMTYTVYFENKSTATAAAQEVKVTNPLSRYLDWSTFEMGEVAFNNQVDLGLNGQQNGTSEVTMNGTSYRVRSKVTLDKADGQVAWYLRIVDPSTATTWPDDVFAGFLPPNDETFRGEGHLTYRIKVRDDAPAGVKITNAASIVFDYNDPIETDPAWWNQVAKVVSVEGLDGKSVNVSVDPAWIKAHVGASATDAEIAAALNAVGKNGLKVWMSAALGLDPENPDDTFRVDVPQNADANVVAAKILGGDQPETNAWMAIQYRLDRDASGDGAVQPGVAQSGRAFGIDVGGAADPTGVYQVKAVFSDDEGTATTEVPAANQIGVLRTAAASAREIVPVPWTKFASEVTDIAVSNLVKTAGLSAGDRLFAYDESAKRYATWELRPDKTWKPLKTIKLVDGRLEAQEAESPEVATVKRGSGVWLERQDTAKPIVLVGQHEAASAVTAINGGTSDLPKWNLLATPAISNWNLNAICEGVDVKDRIIVPTGKEPRIYTRDAANAKWGYMGYEANDKGIVKPVRKEDDTMLAPGTGFWYISEGGAPVITW